ncbi:hypothetical protein V6N12_001148 [Hibiscus sabdariffa]|uniref:Uncharacterized protein n=1 Tax=Hibiscus sabdariffa TaxID=183260 RepID=A0ABR2C6E0_9ROSI
MISISEIGFSDDSDRPWDRKWKSAKEESDDLKDVESFSDVNSPKRGMVGEDGCSSGTEVDAIKAMCAEREYDDYCHREKNGLGSRSIGEEGLGGSSKEETADYGNRNEEGNKENGAKNEECTKTQMIGLYKAGMVAALDSGQGSEEHYG